MKREFHIEISNRAASSHQRTLDDGLPRSLFARLKSILSGLAVSALAIGMLIAMIAVGSVIAGILIAIILLIVAWLLIRASLKRGRA
jgi:ABC-type multidrug transport system permease subunit